MKNYFITGASGFVAQRLIPELLQQSETRVFALIHQHEPHFSEVNQRLHFVYSIQDIKNILVQTDEKTLDSVIHLAGAGIADWPWTPKRREVLIESRWELISRLHQSISDAELEVKHIMGASAVGFYGDGGTFWLDENSEQGRGFAAELCAGIERRLANAAQEANASWHALRFGVVLGEGGGMLSRLALPARFGLSSIFGSGEQWVSWIDHEDLVNGIQFIQGSAIESGPVNMTSPEPVQWQVFMDHLSKLYGHKTRLRIPKIALAALGEMKSIFLDSVRVCPRVLLDAGFTFKHQNIDQCLQHHLLAG